MLRSFLNLTPTTLIIQKNFNISKNILLTFLFLTNNFSLYFIWLNYYKTFFLLNTFKSFFQIKKNKFFFIKLYSRFRNFFNFNKYVFKFSFKNNKFLTFNLNTKNSFFKKNFNLNLFFKNHLTFLYYKNNFFKNWNYLIGSPISSFNAELHANRKLFRKDLKIIFIQNRLFFNKNPFNYTLSRKPYYKIKNTNFSKTPLFRKLFINNFFYLNKKKINYNQLAFLLKNKNKKKYKIKMSKNWLLTKPYMFLNNSYSSKPYKYYPNYYLFSLFKNYFKIFKKIKKFKFKFKKFTDLNFKKNFFHKNNLSRFTNNYWHKTFVPFRKEPKVFIFKNLFNLHFHNSRINKFSKPIKIKIKKKIKIFSFFKLFQKSIFLKKNKNYSNFFSPKYVVISPFFNFYLNKIRKNSRRLKKINNFFKLKYTFFKVSYLFFNFPNRYNKIINFSLNPFFINSLFNKYDNFFYFFKINILKKKLVQLNPLFTFSSKFPLKLRFINKNTLLFPTSSIFIQKKKIMKKRLFFITKEKTPFIANKLNFLFINDYSIFSFFKEKFFYNIKKTHYSFLYKNELQRYILKRYSKFSFLNKYIKNNFIQDRAEHHFFFTNNFNLCSIELNNTNLTYFILNKQLYSSNKWTYFRNQINFSKNYIKDEYNFNIKRIKFKPGYMTIWRDSRTVLKNTLSLSFKYQHRLTKYLSKYNKFVKFKTYLILEMTIFNILLKTKFFLNESVCFSFFKNNLIYLNGFICNNPKIQLFIGDFVQLTINNKYYILYKWFLNISITKKRKLKQILKKKINISFDTVEKKKSNRLPNWILFNKNSINDIPKYLEVDYLTLSAFVLYEPFSWSDINVYNLINYRFGIINLYNWKYIT